MREQRILVVDVGGNNVKLRHGHEAERRKFASGPAITPEEMIAGVIAHTQDWPFECITIGCPGPVSHNRITLDPVNLGQGWRDFDFEAAFDKPTRVINDAAMQALGSYSGGKMLFLGLGTGLGAALIAENTVVPLEVAHLPYKSRWTFEDCVGRRGLLRMGKKRWERAVADVVARLKAALLAEYVVLGGGNVGRLKELPPDCQRGDNSNAFAGGFRLWQEPIIVV